MDGNVKLALNRMGIVKPEEPMGERDIICSSHDPRKLYPLDARPTPLSRVKQIWAVGGGKGGVGKSLMASSLAICLARLGNKVTAVDLDLGGANLHTTLGIDLPKQTLSDFMSGRYPDLRECTARTAIPNLDIISGAQDAMSIPHIRPQQKIDFLKKVRLLDADYVIFDLGAGTGYTTLDFFNYSDIGFMTLLPEPTSIENGYRFIKSAYYRYLAHCESLAPIRPLIDSIMDPQQGSATRTPSELFREVSNMNPELAMTLKKRIEQFQPKLILNQVRTQTDIDIGHSVKSVCKKYFGIDMEYLGHLEYDSAVWQAIRKKRPVLLEFPHARISASLETMVHNLIQPMHLRRSKP